MFFSLITASLIPLLPPSNYSGWLGPFVPRRPVVSFEYVSRLRSSRLHPNKSSTLISRVYCLFKFIALRHTRGHGWVLLIGWLFWSQGRLKNVWLIPVWIFWVTYWRREPSICTFQVFFQLMFVLWSVTRTIEASWLWHTAALVGHRAWLTLFLHTFKRGWPRVRKKHQKKPATCHSPTATEGQEVPIEYRFLWRNEGSLCIMY